MIAELVIAAAAAAAPPPDDVDCVRPHAEQIRPPAPRHRKPITTGYRPKRLFKTEPKPKDEEEPCAPPARPPITVLETPAPLVSLPPGELPEPDGLPLMVVTPLELPPEEAPPETFAPPGGFVTFEGPCCALPPPGLAAPAPEPATWALLALGLLGIVGWKARA